MADFFSRLAERTLDVAPVVRPTLGSLFSSENLFPAGYDDAAPAPGDGFGDDSEAGEAEDAADGHRSAAPHEERSRPQLPPAEARQPEDHHISRRSDPAPEAGRRGPDHRAAVDGPAREIPRPEMDADAGLRPAPDTDPPSPAGDGAATASGHTLLPAQPFDPGTIRSFLGDDAPDDELHEHAEIAREDPEGEGAAPGAGHGVREQGSARADGTIENGKGRPTVGSVEKAPNAGVAERSERTLVPVQPTTARAPWWSSLANGASPAPLDAPRGAELSAPDESGGIASRRDAAADPSGDGAAAAGPDGAAPRRAAGTPEARRGNGSAEGERSPFPRSTHRIDGETMRRGEAAAGRPAGDTEEIVNERRELVPGRTRQTPRQAGRSDVRRARPDAPSGEQGARDADRRESLEARRLVPVKGRQSASELASMVAGEQAAARRESRAQSETQPIRVTIGRIEIKAQMQTPPVPQARQAAPERTGPIITLDNYLKQRNRRSR